MGLLWLVSWVEYTRWNNACQLIGVLVHLFVYYNSKYIHVIVHKKMKKMKSFTKGVTHKWLP